MLHYYPRHVSSINMPIFRRKNCIRTASGIVALCKRLHSTPVESGIWYNKTCRARQITPTYDNIRVCSQPVYCAAVYRERRYQMLCEYNFSS